MSVLIVVHGSGSIGIRHARALRELAGVEVIVSPVRSERLLELTGEGFRAEPIESALARRPNGVVVATDTGRHTEDALRAIAAGSAVLVEKPLAPNRAAAEMIVREASAAGRDVHVACCLRFDTGLGWIRERLPALGHLRAADAECMSWLPAWRPGRDHREGYAARRNEGGVLLDLVHEIDYSAWLLGRHRRVSALLRSGVLGLAPGVEETAFLIGVHDDELPMTLRLSYAVQPSTRRLRIWGEHGLLEWDYVGRMARRVDVDGRETDRLSFDTSTLYSRQAEAWVRSLRKEPVSELVTAREGLLAVAVCDAARAAASSGKWMEVDAG